MAWSRWAYSDERVLPLLLSLCSAWGWSAVLEDVPLPRFGAVILPRWDSPPRAAARVTTGASQPWLRTERCGMTWKPLGSPRIRTRHSWTTMRPVGMHSEGIRLTGDSV